MGRRRRPGLLLAGLLGLPVLGAIGVYSWIHRVADSRWAAAQERIRQLSAAYPEGDGRRDPETVSEASKENQIHFVAAIRMAAPARFGKESTWKLVVGRRTEKAADEFLDEAAEWLDRLHVGARRIAGSPSDFPPRWHGDWDYYTLAHMMHCGVLLARRQREEKQPFEAAETLLDSLQLARFWAISGTRINREFALETVPANVEELRSLLCEAPLSAEELRRVERELEPLDAATKSPLLDLEPQLARWGETVAAQDLKDSSLSLYTSGWRWKFLLPGRLMKAEAFDFAERQVRILLEAEPKGYVALQARWREFDREYEETLNPILRLKDFRLGLLWSELEFKTQLRLLRVAARYRATGEVIAPEDPYGRNLLHSEQAAGMKFWSVGQDGHDDGGHTGGDGRWFHPGPGDGPLPKDLVIEVPARP